MDIPKNSTRLILSFTFAFVGLVLSILIDAFGESNIYPYVRENVQELLVAYRDFSFLGKIILFSLVLISFTTPVVIFVYQSRKKNVDETERFIFKQTALAEEFSEISPKVVDFCKKTLGDLAEVAALPVEKVNMHLKINPNCLFYFYTKNSKSAEISLKAVGLACALKSSTVEDILSGVITSGHQITSNDLYSNFNEAYGIYVMGLYATTPYSRGRILERFQRFICSSILNDEMPHLQFIFAKGSTKEGKRALVSAGFTKLDVDKSEIWKLPSAEAKSLCLEG